MPSVGFVISTLEPGHDAKSPEMIESWNYSRELHQSWFNSDEHYPMVIWAGYEDPSLLIQASPWSCPEEQFQEFARSEEMADYLDEFGDALALEGAFHLDLKWSDVPVEAPFLAVTRYWVDPEDKREFESLWKHHSPMFSNKCGGRAPAGWRVKGGWQERAKEDHASQVTGTAEGRPGALGDYMSEDEDETLLEWVCLMGFVDEERVKATIHERDSEVTQKPQDWKALAAIVGVSQRITNHYLERIDYEKSET